MADGLTHAAPVLRRHGFPATLFVPTAWIGGVMGWEPPHPSAAPLEIMSIDEIVACERLAVFLGHPPRYLAYPWGKHSATVRGAVQRAGFEAAFSINQVADGRYARERVAIRRSDPRLQLPVLGWYRQRR